MISLANAGKKRTNSTPFATSRLDYASLTTKPLLALRATPVAPLALKLPLPSALLLNREAGVDSLRRDDSLLINPRSGLHRSR